MDISDRGRSGNCNSYVYDNVKENYIFDGLIKFVGIISYCILLQMRRSDILMVLLIDMAYFGRYPNTIAWIGYGKLVY